MFLEVGGTLKEPPDVIAARVFFAEMGFAGAALASDWGRESRGHPFFIRILQEASHLASYLLGTHGADSWIERAGPGYVSVLRSCVHFRYPKARTTPVSVTLYARSAA